MHTMWKGSISFGLVHVPVKMHSATEEKDISMKQIHEECGSNITSIRSCPNCNREVSYEEIVKGYEYDQGRFISFSKDELEQLLPESDKVIKILDFVEANEIDPVYYQKTYYLSPGDTGAKTYNLLLHALKTTKKIGICKVSIRSKENLAALRVIGDCIALETIFYPDEVRPLDQVPNLPTDQVDKKELKLAQILIKHLTTTFDPSRYKDEYRALLINAIQKKIEGEDIHTRVVARKENKVPNQSLMSALQASLDIYKPVEQQVEEPPKKQKRSKKEKVDPDSIIIEVTETA